MDVVNYLRPIFVVRYLWGKAKGLQEICVTFGDIFLTFGNIFVTFVSIFVTFGTLSGPFKNIWHWHFGITFRGNLGQSFHTILL